MKKVTITLPDNCDLVKESNSYVIKEKDTKPKSWEDFCEKFPLTSEDCYIDTNSTISQFSLIKGLKRNAKHDKNYCISWVEAEAFLALMQLRQLRKAWIGDWINFNDIAFSIYAERGVLLEVSVFSVDRVLSFPTKEMAEEFLNCFRDLCETAKILL